MSFDKRAPKYSEPDYAKSDGKKSDYPWYLENIDKHLVPETQKLLEGYSKVPRDQQSQHVHEIRAQAWAIRAYPCTGLGVWLVPFISRSPAYRTILDRLRAGATFLDIGCFLGGDMRRLVFDGAPSENMYGVDIVSHWDVGYVLFRDTGRFHAHFIEADMLSEDDGALLALKGRVDVISISAVLHQWSWEGQVEAAEKLVEFSKPGSLVVGYQIGGVDGKEVAAPGKQDRTQRDAQMTQYRHDPASFERMWEQIGLRTGTTWEVKAWLRSWEYMGWDPEDCAWLGPEARVLDFAVTRRR